MSLSQVLYPRVTIVKQMLEIASHSPPYRDNCHLKALWIQAPENMNRHPLCAAGAQHRKDMNDSNLLHDFVRRPAGESFIQRKARDPEPAVSGDHGRSKTAARCLGGWGEASTREGHFWTAPPHWAINRPKKNHVGLRISQVRLDTPIAQTIKHTIHTFRGMGGRALREFTKTPSIAQKIAKPRMPCSTSTERKVLCAGGAGESTSSRRMGSSKTRLTTTRNAFDPMPRNGCSRKMSQPAPQMTVRPDMVPWSNASGMVDNRSHEVEGTKARAATTRSDTVRRTATFCLTVNHDRVRGTIARAARLASVAPPEAVSKTVVPASTSCNR